MAQAKRVALITGAASGIGEAAATVFAQRGYQVVGLDLVKRSATASRPPSIVESGVAWRQCDVSVERQVKRVVGEVVGRFGRIDVLVNNAGLVLTKPLTQTLWGEYDRLFGVNVGGQFLMCKYAIPAMRKSKGGAIVNMASVSGHVGSVNNVLYCGTKGAVLALTKALALELAEDRIRVNSISPGYIDTPMLSNDLASQAKLTGVTLDEVVARETAGQLFRRFASPIEVAEAIFFLAGDAASFITGTDLIVDCGCVAK
ncbi:MAG: SDR family NAD(P)-dependent oxidoreductase [Chloroflexi bacterium]|nr:SDR family NAD(P)-dependent oxidoreductase [Chloroflexota bacterium]